MIDSGKLAVTHAFKGMDSSDAVKEYAGKRIQKISKLVHNMTNCHFVFFKEKLDFVAQLHVISGDFEARAEGREDSMNAAIDAVTDKVEHQAQRHKEKVKNH